MGDRDGGLFRKPIVIRHKLSRGDEAVARRRLTKACESTAPGNTVRLAAERRQVSLSADSGHHLARRRIDHRAAVDDHGWYGLVSGGDRADERGRGRVLPDVDLVDSQVMPT